MQVALKALSLKGIKDWKQLELFQREAVVLQVRVCVCVSSAAIGSGTNACKRCSTCVAN